MNVTFGRPSQDGRRELTFHIPYPRTSKHLLEQRSLNKELLARLLSHVFIDPVFIGGDGVEDHFVVTYDFDNKANLKDLQLALYLFETGQEWTRFARA